MYESNGTMDPQSRSTTVALLAETPSSSAIPLLSVTDSSILISSTSSTSTSSSFLANKPTTPPSPMINIKSSKPPAHIKDLIYYKYRDSNYLSNNGATSTETVPSDYQASKPATVTIVNKSTDIPNNLSPSNLSNSPPLNNNNNNGLSSSLKLNNLNDSQSSASSTTSLSATAGFTDCAKYQQSKKASKKKAVLVTNDLDEERTSQLVSDIIKNIKEKTKELESQNQSLKTAITTNGTGETSSNCSNSSTNGSVTPNGFVTQTTSPTVPVITLNAPSSPKAAAVAGSNSPPVNLCFNIIQPFGNQANSYSVTPSTSPVLQFHQLDSTQFSTLPIASSQVETVTDTSVSKGSVKPKKQTPTSSLSNRAKTIDVPLGWNRYINRDASVVYKSPSGDELKSIQDVRAYLMSENTCKCGLECPLDVYATFNFNSNMASRLKTSVRKSSSSSPVSQNECHCQAYSKSTSMLEVIARQNKRDQQGASGPRPAKKAKILDELNENTSFKRNGESQQKQRSRPNSANSLIVPSPSFSNDSTSSHSFQLQQQQPSILIVNPDPDNYVLVRKSPTYVEETGLVMSQSDRVTIAQLNFPFVVNGATKQPSNSSFLTATPANTASTQFNIIHSNNNGHATSFEDSIQIKAIGTSTPSTTTLGIPISETIVIF